MTNLKNLDCTAYKKDSICVLFETCLEADTKGLISTQAMNAVVNDPENEILDVKADNLYREYWMACKNIAAQLVDITDGIIDKKTSFCMAFYKRSEILAICDKLHQKSKDITCQQPTLYPNW